MVHLGVAEDVEAAEALELDVTGLDYTGSDVGGVFGLFRGGYFLIGYSGYMKLDVDAVQERAGDFPVVALDFHRGAGTFLVWVTVIATGTRVKGCYKDNAGGESKGSIYSGDTDFPVF